MSDPYAGPDRFCSGCRTWKPEHLIESKRTVVFPHGKSINYYCWACAEKMRERQAKAAQS